MFGFNGFFEKIVYVFLFVLMIFSPYPILAKEVKVLNNNIWKKAKRGQPFFWVAQKEIGLKPANNYKKYSQLRQDIINSALNYLGLPYDTGIKGDGFAKKDEDGKYVIKDNNTGKVYKVKLKKGQRPMVCTDLVVAALEDAGFLISLQGFHKRRIRTVLKEFFRKNDNFLVVDLNVSYDIKKEKLDLQGNKVLPGDIIITKKGKNIKSPYGWHVGIVETVDKNGFPKTIIHSAGHAGVTITRAVSRGYYQDHRTGRDRYDGFFSSGDRIWIVKLKK